MDDANDQSDQGRDAEAVPLSHNRFDICSICLKTGEVILPELDNILAANPLRLAGRRLVAPMVDEGHVEGDTMEGFAPDSASRDAL